MAVAAASGAGPPAAGAWALLIRWACPAGIGLIIGGTFYAMF